MTILTTNTDQLRRVVAEHIAADAVVQGDYWDRNEERGCFIGCLAHSNDPSVPERTYGLPVMVQRIAEGIFEALPPDEARQFFAALPEAVACDGKDLSRVGWQFLAAELRSLQPQPPEVQAVVDPVIAGLDLLAKGQQWPGAAAADVAAARVASVTAAAAWAAWAASASASAARAPDDAERFCAAAAAWAAADADAAARLTARRRQRGLLLQLISSAPVV